VVEMIGAVMLQRALAGNLPKIAGSLDAEQVMANAADDVTLTFVGYPPIVGKAAATDFYRAYFAKVVAEHGVCRNVAVTRPWAMGLTNTIIVEADFDVTHKDGTKEAFTDLEVFELRRGKTVAIRKYVVGAITREILEERSASAS
jgi:ketosteroid isomerase-like protein